MTFKDKAFLAILAAVVIGIVQLNRDDGQIYVSAWDVMERIGTAESDIVLVSSSQSDTLNRITQLESQLVNLAESHNNLVTVMSRAGQIQQNNLLMMSTALSHLNGKLDWDAALAGARTELEAQVEAAANAVAEEPETEE